MIVVHVKRSYAAVLRRARHLPTPTDEEIAEAVRQGTIGNWPHASDESFEAYGDYLAGVDEEGTIVSIYRITGRGICSEPGDEGKDVYRVESADEMAWMLGHTNPGGRFKRGESRGVRYFNTGDVVKAFEDRGVTWPTEGPEATVDQRVVALVRQRTEPKPSLSGRGATLVEQVEVEKDPRGGVIVTVPMGTRVTIVQRQQEAGLDER